MALFNRDVSSPPEPSGSLLTSKWGPMPVWAWMLIGLGVAIAFRSWQSNRTAGQQQTATTDLSGTTTPPTVYQDYITITNPINTPPDQPPGQGRAEPPQGPDVHIPPGERPVPVPPPGQAPAPKPATGRWVTVQKWTAKNAPWNSTLSGIAKHYGVKSWQTIWNAPQNKALKARRKQPNLIQPGDRIWVPA